MEAFEKGCGSGRASHNPRTSLYTCGPQNSTFVAIMTNFPSLFASQTLPSGPSLAAGPCLLLPLCVPHHPSPGVWALTPAWSSAGAWPEHLSAPHRHQAPGPQRPEEMRMRNSSSPMAQPPPDTKQALPQHRAHLLRPPP